MHLCQVRVAKAKAKYQGQDRNCGKKAVVAYNVRINWTWKGYSAENRTVCLCSEHRPNPQEEHSLNKAIGSVFGSWHRVKDFHVNGEVDLNSVKDSRVEDGIIQVTRRVVQLMSTKNYGWIQDEQWERIFEQAIIDKKVGDVVDK